MSWWREESPRGRLRRATAGMLVLAVVFGLQGLLQYGNDSSVAFLLWVSAGCLLAGGLALQYLGRRAEAGRGPGRRAITVDPSRYLMTNNGQAVTVNSLKHIRRRHRNLGVALIVTVCVGAAVTTAASGASNLVAGFVMAGTLLLFVTPLFVITAVDLARITRAIDQLLANEG